MKRTTRDALVTVGVVVPFLVLALLVPSLLTLAGVVATLARVAFVLLGLTAGTVVFLYLRAQAKANPESPGVSEEIDAAVGRIARRLKDARRGRLRTLPVVFVIGPSGSAKTTSLVRSGLEPELLTGEVYRGDATIPLPTATLNAWLLGDTVLVEAGGALSNDPVRWARLVKHLRPGRLRSLLPGGPPPRMALVCYGCDEFLKPSAGGDVVAAAKSLRTRLVDLGRGMGMRIPVYALLTKADRLPHFEDFVRMLTKEEASSVLGATLPVPDAAAAASYDEIEGTRIGRSMERMFRALALTRLELLAREGDEATRTSAYEFPRELRKITALATQFLVDLCRPSQLGASPFLRGCYFSGVRPVQVTSAAVGPPTAAPSTGAPVEATAVFNPAVAAQPQAAAHPSSGRRVPEWVFLRRVLADLVLGDALARAATAGGARVSFMRRLVLGTVAFALAWAMVAVFVSWRLNAGTFHAAASAAGAVASLGLPGGGIPTMEELQALDSLRAHLAELRRWEEEGPPLSRRWGLYRGDDVLGELRPLYFGRFEGMLWGAARGRLIAFLERLPDSPEDAAVGYDAAYNALKAYLITHGNGQESTGEFLAPELMRQWSTARRVDAARVPLIERQFAFFAGELPHGDPYQGVGEADVVERSRGFLKQFGNVDQFYQALVSEASEMAPAVQFSDTPEIADGVVVPGAFTVQGWTFVQENLANVDRLFARESWVLGDAVVDPGDRVRLADEMRQRYEDEYVSRWQAFLDGGRVTAFGGAADAAARLATLSDRSSPLLQLLSLAALHTAVDSTRLAQAFQPLHAVVPPEAARAEQLITDANRPYMQGLLGLGEAMGQVAEAPPGPERDGARGQANTSAGQLLTQVRSIAQAFNPAGDAQAVGDAVANLLSAPIRSADRLLASLPTADANRAGTEFCRLLNPLLAKFPFSRSAIQEATLDEVSAMFKPDASLLRNFYEQNLTQMLAPQGNGRYGRVPGSALQPTRAFELFFNRAAEVSNALFGEGERPQMAFDLRPEASAQLSQVRVEIEGQTLEVTPTRRASRPFIWTGTGSRGARIVTTVNGQDVIVAEHRGPWAVFRLFHEATWTQSSAGEYRLSWRVPGQTAPLTAVLRFDERIPIFEPSYFDGFTCVARMR